MKNIIIKKEVLAILKGIKVSIGAIARIISTFAIFFIIANVLTIIVSISYLLFKIIIEQVTFEEISYLFANLYSINDDFTHPFCVIMNITQCISMICSILISLKIYYKKGLDYIGFNDIRKNYRYLIQGLIMGALSIVTMFIISLITNNISIKDYPSICNVNFSFLQGLILFIFVGINEELFARGYCMTVLSRLKHKYFVFIIPAVIFSLMHAFNSNMSFISYLNLFLFGILAELMFLNTRSLWGPIGYHIAWNYFQGYICGFNVSGISTPNFFKIDNYENIIAGGEFGLEGGLLVTIVILLEIMYIWKKYKIKVECLPCNKENLDK